jgi:hypothetical protein
MGVTEEKTLDKEAKKRMKFTCYIIPYFAEACKIDKREAYLYLKKYGGLDYIREHWWALHTDNPYYSALDILEICKTNGGYLI